MYNNGVQKTNECKYRTDADLHEHITVICNTRTLVHTKLQHKFKFVVDDIPVPSYTYTIVGGVRSTRYVDEY